MKKLVLTLMGLFASVSAFADISVPISNGGFEATVEGLYLNPSSESFNYNSVLPVLRPITYPGYVFNTQNHSFNMRYQWGFLLGVGYLFANTGNDIQVNWMHLDTGTVNSTNQLTLPPVSPFQNGIYNASTSEAAQNKLDLDNVDIDLGQYLNIGSQLTTRFFTGLRYTNINQDFSSQSYFNNIVTSLASTEAHIYSTSAISADYAGIGPLLGVDATYALADGFGLQGSVDGAVLVGSTRSSGSLFLNEQDIRSSKNVSSSQNIPTFSQTQVVPTTDAKLALDYSHNFNSIDFTVAAGYQVSEYFNALNRINADSASFIAANPNILPNFSGSFSPLPVTYKSENLALDGPFLSLTVKA